MPDFPRSKRPSDLRPSAVPPSTRSLSQRPADRDAKLRHAPLTGSANLRPKTNLIRPSVQESPTLAKPNRAAVSAPPGRESLRTSSPSSAHSHSISSLEKPSRNSLSSGLANIERRLSMPSLESPARSSLTSIPVQAEKRSSLQGFDATRVEMGNTGDLRNTDNDPNAVRVKGINFLAFLDGVSKCFGATSRLDLEKGMGGEIGDAIKFGGIVAGGWYKVSWYRLLWRTAVDLLNLDEAHCRRLSQKATAISVNIAYRTLAKITSPTLFINACPRVYSTYFDKGQLVVLSSEPGKFVVE